MLYADIIIAIKLVHCLFAIKHETGVVVSILRSSRAFVEKLPLLNGKRTNPLDIIRPQREPNKNGCNARNPSAHCIPSAVLHISLFFLLSLFFVLFLFFFLLLLCFTADILQPLSCSSIQSLKVLLARLQFRPSPWHMER